MPETLPPKRRGRPPKSTAPNFTTAEVAPIPRLDILLGPAPLLEGEDEEAYRAFCDEVRSHVAPRDIIEEIYTRDAIDLTWDLTRLKRIRTGILQKGQTYALRRIKAEDYWPGLDAEARGSIGRAADMGLKHSIVAARRHGISQTDIDARAFASERETLLIVERDIMQVELRRNRFFQEIERRRATLARRLADRLGQAEGDAVKPNGMATTLLCTAT